MFGAPNLLLTPLAAATTPATFISGTSAEATSITTMPTHQKDDLLLMFAFRDGSNTLPTLPAGWTQIISRGANTCSARLAYKIAASSSETSGTWTNTTELVCQVYRGVYANNPAGASITGGGSSATVNYPALSLFSADGNSVVAAFGGHRSVNGSMGTAPTGMTQRANTEGATADAAGFDTNGGVTSWSSQNVSSGETASGYNTFVVEILPAGYTGILFDAVSSPTEGSVSSFSWSHTAASGADIFVDVCLYSASRTVTSITCGGTAMTLWKSTALTTNAAAGGTHYRYRLAGAGNGTAKTIAVTLSSGDYSSAAAVSYLNVVSISDGGSVSGNGLSLSHSVTVPSGSWALQAFGGAAGIFSTMTSTGGGINRFNDAGTGGIANLSISDATATTTFTATESQSADYDGMSTLLSPT